MSNSEDNKILPELNDEKDKSKNESIRDVFLGPYEASSHVMAYSRKPAGGESATLQFQEDPLERVHRGKPHLTASATAPNPLSLYSGSPKEKDLQDSDDSQVTGVQWLKRHLSSDSEFQNVSQSIMNTCFNFSSTVQWSIGGDESEDEELIDINMNRSNWISIDQNPEAEDDAEHIMEIGNLDDADSSGQIGSAAHASGEFVDQNRVGNLLASSSSQNNSEPLHTQQHQFIDDSSMLSEFNIEQNKQQFDEDESTLDQISSLRSDTSNSNIESNYSLINDTLIDQDPLKYDQLLNSPCEMSENDNTLKYHILDKDMILLENIESSEREINEVKYNSDDINNVNDDFSPNQIISSNDSIDEWSRTFPDSTVISNKTNVNSNLSNINTSFPSITQETFQSSNTNQNSQNVFLSFINKHYGLVSSICLVPILWSFMPGIIMITGISICALLLAFHGKIQGETTSVNDQPPITKVTRSYFTYETPESDKKEPLKIESADAEKLIDEDTQQNKQKKFTTSTTLVRKSSNDHVQKSKSGEKITTSKFRTSPKSSEESPRIITKTSTTKTTRTERKSSGTGDELEGRSSPSRRTSASPPLRKSSGTTTSSTTETGSHRTITRGNSVRALSEKFMKAASPITTKQLSSSNETSQKSETETKSSTTVNSTVQEHRSFLDNRTRVTDVHDVLDRMRNADLQNVNLDDGSSGDTQQDQEARALLNKFLGASVILSGLDACGVGGSAALVSQVERQRILKTSSSTQSTNNTKEINLENLEAIWDERSLRQLLENSSDYEDRRKIRARLRTVMAEQKACANVVAEVQADQQRTLTTSDETGSGECHVRQGESQLLPLLVQQLRSSLFLDSSVNQKTNVEDSGTESGEDLKFLAAGIRDSIELQRGTADGKQDDSSDSIGPRILEEVLSALARLQNSLQNANSLYEIEPSRRENLLQLVTRLQSSLKTPAPPPNPRQLNIPKRFGAGGSQARRLNRQARHTVGVSREELEDARRLLEKGEISPTPDALKRGSCGNVEIPGVGSAFQAYRPVHFTPQRTNSGNNLISEIKPVPFPFNEKTSPLKAHPNLIQSLSLDSSNKHINNNREHINASQIHKNNLENPSSSGFLFNKKLAEKNLLTAVSKEFKPGKIGEDCLRPLKSVSQSSSVESVPGSKFSTPQRSNSSNSMNAQQSKSSISQTSSSGTSKESTPFGSDRDKHDLKTFPSKTQVYPQKLSLDLTHERIPVENIEQKTANPYPKSESNNIETPSLEFDPSLLLFTPSQAAQIAIHKAAINKQISMEEDKRREESNSRKSSIDLKQNQEKNYIDSKESEHNSSSEGDVSSEEDEPITTMNKQNVNNLNQIQPISKQNTFNKEETQSQFNEVSPSQSLLINNDSLVNDQKTSKMLADSWISPECRQNFEKPKTYQSHHEPSGFVLTSAQRLLQIASDQNDIKPKTIDRKVKMKRANTIDIPKPLNFYAIEDESDYSSEDEFQSKQTSYNRNQRPSYYSLRGSEGQPSAPPEFQPKTENDKKFLNFLQKHNETKGDKSETKLISYNPNARGGHHWSNRFSNIKTTFESVNHSTPGQKPLNSGSFGKTNTKASGSSDMSARQFWKSADDSVTIMKTNTAITNGPKLSKQGSIFLKKLHEQKDLEKQQSQPRLPWAEEGVVVGSLTVAGPKLNPNQPNHTVMSKRQIFGSSPVQSVNKFSHAPMSAFRPIEKKSGSKTPDSSFSGTVRNIAAEKFSKGKENLSLVLNNGTTNKASPLKKEPQIISSNSPTLPWTREGFHQNSENRVLNSTVAKFENHPSNVASPVYSKILKPISTPPQPPIRALPTSHQFYENPPTIPTPPLLSAPNLVQTFNVKTPDENKFNYSQQSQFYSGNNSTNRNNHENISQINDNSNYSQHYNTNNISNNPIRLENVDYTNDKYFPRNSNNYDLDISQMEEFANQEERKPSPQTYSGSVVSRSQIYPDALYREPSNWEPSGYIPPPLHNTQPPPPPQRRGSLNLSLNTISQDILTAPDIVPSPEGFTAVSRVMGAAQSHQAVTTSNKTRHRKDEFEEDGRSNAARNLASMLTRLSVTPSDSSSSPQKSPQKSPLPLTSGDSPTISLTRNRSEPNIASMISDEEYEYYQKQLALVSGSSIAKVPSLIPLQEKYREINSYGNLRTRPASTESLITATSTEARHAETGESVLTTRLQIPVAPSGRPISPVNVLRKSESWHQLHGGSGARPRRPQSMAIPEGLVSQPVNTPPQLPTGPRRLVKTKSSHALAFSKQFEAALTPDSIQVKKNKVEAYFKAKTPITNPSPIKKPIELVDDTLENVDAAFESIFKSSVSSGTNSRPGHSLASK